MLGVMRYTDRGVGIIQLGENTAEAARQARLAASYASILLGGGSVYNSLAAIALVSPSAGTVPYYTGSSTAGLLTVDIDTTLASNGDNRLATQKAIKSYVDNKIAGLSWKQAVRAATTTAGTLATSFANGQVIDGVTLATGDRILIKNQSAPAENGIYIINSSGAPTRADDANSGAELVNASVFVSEGSTLAETQWTCSTNAPITIGSTSLSFVQSGTTGGASYVLKAGDTMTGPLITVPSATGGAGIVIPHGTAPTSPNPGEVWSTTAGFFARVATVTHQFAMVAGAQTFTSKTINLTDNTLTGTLAEFNTACSDADFSADKPAISTVNASFTAANTDNNTHKVASGSGQTITLNSTPAAGVSFTLRFTTAWSISCAGGLSKNGASPSGVTSGSIAANSLVTFLHEGSGVWIVSGNGIT